MIRKTLVAVLALVPAIALAQEEAAGRGSPAEPEGAPVEAAPAEPVPPDDALPGTGPVDAGPTDSAYGVPPPDTYTVQSGDTLWDLSGRFLNNPWYWPKIWSYNPEIANPHWIYPGNLIRFYPSAEESPTRVEPVPIAQAEEIEPVRELEELDEADVVAVAGPYKIGYVPPRSRFARRDTFVTPRELEESGLLRASFEEKLMLSSFDRAYADFRNAANVKVGETYIVYKTERPIYHPVTKELFGYQSRVVGTAKVVAVDDRAATVVIAQTLDPIERGAMLGPWTQRLLRPIDRKPNRQAVDGRIIAAQVDVVTQMGENHIVFVDKGTRDGVEEGNVFTVLRSGDQYGRDPNAPTWDPDLPIETVGDLLVVDAKERASTALVTRSLRELMIGDRIRMRPEGGSGGN